MPVYTLQCPDCGHRFMGMVMAHTKPPRESGLFNAIY